MVAGLLQLFGGDFGFTDLRSKINSAQNQGQCNKFRIVRFYASMSVEDIRFNGLLVFRNTSRDFLADNFQKFIVAQIFHAYLFSIGKVPVIEGQLRLDAICRERPGRLIQATSHRIPFELETLDGDVVA